MVSHVRSRTERERQSGSCCSGQVMGRLERWVGVREEWASKTEEDGWMCEW